MKTFETVAQMKLSSLKTGQLVRTKGYYTAGGLGGATYLIEAPQTVDGWGDHELANSNTAVLQDKEHHYLEAFGAQGGAGDSYAAIYAAMTALEELKLHPNSMYGTSQQIEVFSRRRIIGAGEDSGFKWVGSTPVTAPNETGGTAVLSFSRPDPTTSALTNVHGSNFTVDLNRTNNLIGTKWQYSTNDSSGRNIECINFGQNCFGHYYSKLWYTTFHGMVALPTGGHDTSGSRSHYISGYYGAINGVDFLNTRSNGAEIGLVLDTKDQTMNNLLISGSFENGVDGVKHITDPTGNGVRSALFDTVYFEGNSNADVHWQSSTSPNETANINWHSCHFNQVSSKAIIQEGGHRFVGCDSLQELDNSGGRVWIDGNSGLVVSGSSTEDIRHLPVVTAQDTKQIFDGTEAQVITGASAKASGLDPTNEPFAIPTNLLSGANPSGGRTIKVNVVGRIPSQGATRYWTGYLSQRGDTDDWLLTKDTGSTESGTWSVGVNGTTGALSVTYTNGQPSTDIYVSWVPF